MREEMNMLDDAFGLAKDACGGKGHAEAKDRLQAKHPKLKWDDIVEAYLKACDLADACYDFGDQCRNKKMTDDEAIDLMKERFQGFSDETYRAALSHGYFISR
jgi:hypothetical protein